MKQFITGIALIAFFFSACNSGKDNTTVNKKEDSSLVSKTVNKEPAQTDNTDSKAKASMEEMVTQYLQIKNALANDNGQDAASAGNAFVESMGKMDKTAFSPSKNKIWEDLSDDAKEMAEHIGKNAGKLEHQREHFDMLSKDMYDMVKAFGAGRPLYKDFCPMYNDNKGAIWLSEIKEIKNPYLGKNMPTCGSVKEEIK